MRILPGVAVAVGVMVLIVMGGCADAKTGPDDPQPASVTFSMFTATTVRNLIVEITGPGIDPPVVQNFAVNDSGFAAGTISVTAGSGRRIVISAVDTAGVTTHRADTTVRLQPGANPALSLVLRPLGATVGVTTTFGAARVLIVSAPTSLVAGDTVTFRAIALAANGDTVTPSNILWGSGDPSVLEIDDGLGTAKRAGQVTVSASYGGAVGRTSVQVDSSRGVLLIEYFAAGESLERASVVRATGMGERLISALSAGNHQFDLSPDRRQLAFARAFDNRLFISDSMGGNVRVLVGSGTNYGPRWSRDGGAIVWCDQVNGLDISTISAAGIGRIRLTDDGAQDCEPDYSPDRSQILFRSNRAGSFDLWLMDSAGGNQRPVASSPGLEGAATWSPAGDRIAFVSDRSGSLQLHTAAADGSDIRQLTQNGALEYRPIWSPDGKRIAITRMESGRPTVWLVNTDGASETRFRVLPANREAEWVVSWRN